MDDLNTIVVIRSAGERTTDLCKYFLRKQLPEEVQIVTIHESPFSAAIRRSFEIGLDSECKWLFCIDADVLVRKDSISDLLGYIESLPQNVFEAQGLILDKFFPVKRPAGIHAYRVSLLPMAMECIPEEGTSLRPESDMLNEMSRRGYPWAQVPVLVGIHDYEQFYRDIYRKCFLQAHKHNWIIPSVEPYWEKLRKNDFDFEVALWGLRSGKIYNSTVYVDKNFVQEEIKDVFSLKKVVEKSELDNHIAAISPDAIIKSYKFTLQEDHFFDQLQERMFPFASWEKTNDLRALEIDKKPSLSQRVLFRMGHIIETTGKRLKNFSKY